MNRLFTILFLLVSSTLQAQPFNLVKEINTTANGDLLINGTFQMQAVGNTVYFVGNTGTSGNELWKTDGTPAGTVMVKDIAPGSASTVFASFTAGDGLLFFVANDGIHGFELWRSDGTETGTFMLRDGFSECTFCLNRMIFHNGFLYFAGNDGTTGAELWKTDGSVAGTVLVKDILPGLPESHPAPTSNANYTFVRLGNELFFTAVDPAGGRELFKTDGTAAGTVMIKDILPGGGSAISTVNHKAAVFNSKVFFAANDGVNGVELWASDGSEAGTYRVTDIAPGTGFSYPNNLIVFNGFLYFTASTTNTGNPNLYKTDGTPGGTVLVKDLVAEGLVLTIGNGAGINDFTVAGNKLFFRINNGPEGTELYATDGTTEGTGLVKDLLPGVGSGNPFAFSVYNNKLIFSATDWVLPSRGTNLYQSDGTAAGTTTVLSGEAGDMITNIFTPKAVVNGRLFFAGNTIDNGQEIWSTDGTVAGTYLVKDINTLRSGTRNSNNAFLGSVVKDGYYFFAAADDDHGTELWKSNGTASGTTIVKDIWPGKGSSNPGQFFIHGNYIYFTAGDNVHGTEVWRTDGTENGTMMVADIFPGELSSSPIRFLSSNNYIYFTAYHPSYGSELWRTDGTPAGSSLVLDAVPGISSGIVGPLDIAIQGSNSYYIVNISAGNTLGITPGNKFLKVDGVTNSLSEMSASIATASDMVVMGNAVYVIGRSTSGQTVLWKTENGGAVTQVKIINPAPFLNTIFQLNVCNGKLYFNAATAAHGAEPWVSDGTELGTYMIKDINPGTNNSIPHQFVYSGGKVFFTAGSSGTGTNTALLDNELWVTDGTETGTYLVKDILPGTTGSRPGGTVAVPGNKILFVANDGTNGVELWESDGTETGTKPVQDFNTAGDGFIPPGVSTFQPADYILTQLGTSTIFFARSADKGAQLYTGSIPAFYYVNDNSTAGDVFTTAAGNDANPGTASAPLRTLEAAYFKAKTGDTIYVDAGTYIFNTDYILSKGITFLGANYMISPNDPADKEKLNPARNTESEIISLTLTAAVANISFQGFTFDPGNRTAFRASNPLTSNFRLLKNRFKVNSSLDQIHLAGSGTPQSTPAQMVNTNVTISDNRFEKYGVNTGTTIVAQLFKNITISDNSFVTNGAITSFEHTALALGYDNRPVDEVLVTNNLFDSLGMVLNGSSLGHVVISGNRMHNTRHLYNFANSYPHNSEFEFSNNLFESSLGIPVMGYNRQGGHLGTSSIYKVESNTLTIVSPGTSPVLGNTPLNTTVAGSVINPAVIFKGNKISFAGNFGLVPRDLLRPIVLRWNQRNVLIENNEITYSGTNIGATSSNNLPVLPAISIYTDNGVGQTIPPGSDINILNNKIHGFRESVIIYDPNGGTGTSTDPYVGYGNLGAGIDVVVSNNSFTGDFLSINNGTVSSVIQASCNWYGSATGQDVRSKISTATVQHVPWLTNGTDNEPATGFQPVPGACDGYPPLIVLDSYTNVTCNGANNGSISITASYGKAPFVFTWTKTGDPQFISHEEDPTGLAPGNYHLSVVDGNGTNIYITDINAESPGSIDVTITEPTLLIASITNNSTACANIATVTANGGTTAYSFLWSNGATTATISNVPAGTYNVVVTDANGCTVSASIALTVSEAFNPSASVTNVSCYGGSNGVITVTNVNGTAPFSFSIDGINFLPGTLPYSFTGLVAGTYNVAVRDVNGCTGFVSKTVAQPSELIITLNSVQTACYGGNNGAISVTVSGGSPAYNYQWNGPGGYTSAQASISNLAAGAYTLTVTDNKGCTKVLNVSVPSYYEVIVSALVTQVACRGDASGSIDLTVSGGSGGGFSFAWLNGPATEDRTNLVSGNYTVDITDLGSGCVTRRTYQVTQPGSLLKLNNPTVTPVSGCEPSELGSITASATGGGQPYQFKLNNGIYQASGTFTGLAAGNYTVWVKDNFGCEKSVTILVEDNGSDQYELVNNPNNNAKNRAVPVSLGQNILARLSENDQDWYRFTTPAGASSEFVMMLTHPTENFAFNMFPGGNNTTALTPASVTPVSKTYILAGNTTYFMNVAGNSSLVCYNLSVDHSIQTRTIPSIYTRENTVREAVTSVEKLSALVYPSPHNGQFTLQINSPVEGPAVIQFWAADGRLVSSRSILLQKGTNNTVNFYNRREAVLFYRILRGKESAIGKILGPN